MSHSLVQNSQIVMAARPLNIAAGGHGLLAANADWVSLTYYEICTIVLATSIGAAGEDLTLTLRQATTNTGAGAKALNFADHWYKQGATVLNAIGQFTHTSLTTAVNTFTDADDAENESLLIIEVATGDMDSDGGFNFLQASIDDIGDTTQFVSLMYILTEPRYKQDISISAIA